MAREAPVESRLRRRIEDVGGACEKHVGGMRGDPDRVCSFPNGYHCLAETKWLEDVKPEEHQLRRHGFWRARGMDVWVIGCDRHISQLVDFAGLQPPRISVGSGAIPGGPPPLHVGGGPWPGKDGDQPHGPGYAKISGVVVFSSTHTRAQARRRRGLVRGER